MFGEEFLEGVDAEARPPPSVERPDTSESTSIVLEARGITDIITRISCSAFKNPTHLIQTKQHIYTYSNKIIQFLISPNLI